MGERSGTFTGERLAGSGLERRGQRRRAVLVAMGLAALLAAGGAHAQFGQRIPGLMTLPDQDFTWNWGRTVDAPGSAGLEDFSARGAQGKFRCSLKGRFSPGAINSSLDARELERRLATSLYFVEDAAYTMSDLDQRNDLAWATLDCAQAVADDSEEASREREERAHAKALRELQKRRERREREQARDAD
jgi:hypothetical protein